MLCKSRRRSRPGAALHSDHLNSPTLTFLKRSAFGLSWRTCQPTSPARSTRPFRLVKLRRLEFHYVPKHASWLNMVAIEIGVLRSQCLVRRIASPEQLVSEIAAWERQRNASGARIKWISQPQKLAPKWAAPTPNRSAPNRPGPKSHNHCAEVLAHRRVEPATPLTSHQASVGKASSGHQPPFGAQLYSPARVDRGL